MKYIMTSGEFTDKCCNAADNHITTYALGTFGWNGSETMKQRALKKNSNLIIKRNIKNMPSSGFMFDCVCFVKAILGGWNGDSTKIYGGTVVLSNSTKTGIVYGIDGLVPDTSADGMIKLCNEVSADFSDLKQGELVWMSGHVGVVVNPKTGLVVECTSKWQSKLLYSHIKGFPSTGVDADKRERVWTKHGKLPWVDYSDQKIKCPYCGKEF